MGKYLWFFIYSLSSAICQDIYWEQILTNDLTSDINKYNYNVGPWTPSPLNANLSLTKILLQIEIYGIKSVDLDSSSVTFSACIRQWWNDTRLKWNPEDYGGVKEIYLRSEGGQPLAWISDIIIREDAGEGLLSNLKYTDQRCTYKGECYFSRLGYLPIQVTFDLTKYPYDTQTVRLSMESWTHQKHRMQVGLYEKPMMVMERTSFAIDNIEWEIIANNSRELMIDYGGSGVYTRVEFEFQIRRQGSTMLIAILIPGAIITFLGIQFIFLPRGEGGRVNYLATILLTEVMFLVMITSSLPLSKFIPQLGWLFLGYTVLLSVLVFCAIITDKIYLLHEDEMKVFLKVNKKKKYLKSKMESIFQSQISDRLSKKYMLPEVQLQNKFSIVDNNNEECPDKQNKSIINQSGENFDFEAQQNIDIDFQGNNHQYLKRHHTKLSKVKDESVQIKGRAEKYIRLIRNIDITVYTTGMIAFIIMTTIQFRFIF